jgi:alkylated DNA repair dioxygenase AlkB
VQLAWQPSLLVDAEPSVDPSFRDAYRVELDDDSWVDVVPGWLTGADKVFAALAADAPWAQRHRIMWGNKVPEPRLTSGWAEADVKRIAPVLVTARAALTKRYGVAFNSGWLNLYRDGRDSVAWHADDEPELGIEPVIASVSLGATRRFHMRHRTRADCRLNVELTHGSLLVMRGPTQHHWTHQVPKTAKPVGPRINLTFRAVVPTS